MNFSVFDSPKRVTCYYDYVRAGVKIETTMPQNRDFNKGIKPELITKWYIPGQQASFWREIEANTNGPRLLQCIPKIELTTLVLRQ